MIYRYGLLQAALVVLCISVLITREPSFCAAQVTPMLTSEMPTLYDTPMLISEMPTVYDVPTGMLDAYAAANNITLRVPNVNNAAFLGNTPPNYCNIGPTWWCGYPDGINHCVLENTTIYPCGYSSLYSCATMMTTAAEFCKNTSMNATAFNGGITGSPAGYFGYYALALYWPGSSCKADSPSKGFCSDYTKPGNEAAMNLVLHGLWPDYGSLYANEPQPPMYAGQYQGWPQFCDTPTMQYSQCAVTGGLCSWSNSTNATFSQSMYETCLRETNQTMCLVPDETIALFAADFERYAPGYLGGGYTFMDHEWTKHGTCIGGYLGTNVSAYMDVSLQWTKFLTGPTNLQYQTLMEFRGKEVPYNLMKVLLNDQAIPTCKKDCSLDEIWYCLGRDASGYPTELMTCPAGTLASDSCYKNGCSFIALPLADPAMAPAEPPIGASVPATTPAQVEAAAVEAGLDAAPAAPSVSFTG